MIIKISGLKNGTDTYEFEGKFENLELDEPLHGSYKVSVVLNKFEDQIILEVSTSTEVDFICDRCSEDYVGNVESNFKLVYLLRAVEDDTGEFNVNYLSPDTDKIDITNDVRDYLILSIPMKKLCKESCKGLCSKCGKNLNEGVCECRDDEIDDRWKTLLDLKN